MLVTSVLMYRQRVIVRAFERAAATTAATACTPVQLGLRPGMAWYQLVRLGVLRCPGDGRYFLDLPGWQRLRRRRRRTALWVATGLLLLLAVLLLARWG